MHTHHGFSLFTPAGVGLGLALSLSGMACTPPPTAAPADAGPTPLPCGIYAAENDDGSCAADATWSSGPELPVARDHHASFVDTHTGQKRLIFAGGGKDGFSELFDGVYAADIGDDGSLSSWRPIGVLPSVRSGMVLVPAAGGVFSIGGKDRQEFFDTVSFATWNDDGTLGDFQTVGQMPPIAEFPQARGVWHHQAFARGGWMYIAGGMTYNGVTTRGVYRAPIEDGALGAWEPLTDMPLALSHHGMGIADDALIIVGGTTREFGEMLSTVFMADFNEDGTLDTWRELTPIPGPRVTPTVGFVGQHMYVIGGMVPEGRTADVLTSMLVARYQDGDVDAWTEGEPLPSPASHVHQMPFVNGRFYVLGGRIIPPSGGIGSTAAVSIGALISHE